MIIYPKNTPIIPKREVDAPIFTTSGEGLTKMEKMLAAIPEAR